MKLVPSRNDGVETPTRFPPDIDVFATYDFMFPLVVPLDHMTAQYAPAVKDADSPDMVFVPLDVMAIVPASTTNDPGAPLLSV